SRPNPTPSHRSSPPVPGYHSRWPSPPPAPNRPTSPSPTSPTTSPTTWARPVGASTRWTPATPPPRSARCSPGPTPPSPHRRPGWSRRSGRTPPHTSPPPPAPTLAAHPPRETSRLLTELASANLITQHTPGRYTLHDLLRAYATHPAHTHDTHPPHHAA